jgi:hypothetical protein
MPVLAMAVDGRTILILMSDSDMTPVSETCQYSPQHKLDGVPATATIETATVGVVLCCEACRALYERLSSKPGRGRDL